MARTIATNTKTFDLSNDVFNNYWWLNYLNRIDSKGVNARNEFNNTKAGWWQQGTVSAYRVIGYATAEELNDAIPYYESRWSTGGGDYGYQHMTIGGISNINNAGWDDNVAFIRMDGSVIGMSDNANDLTSIYYMRKPNLTIYNNNGARTTISTGANVLGFTPEIMIRGRFNSNKSNSTSSTVSRNPEYWYNEYYSPIRHHYWRPIILAVSETGGKIRLITNSPNVKFGVHFSSGRIEFGSTDNQGVITVTNGGNMTDENRWVRIVIYLNGVEWLSSFRHAIKYMNNANEYDFNSNKKYNPNGAYNCLTRITQEPTVNGMKRFAVINNRTYRATNVTDLISGRRIELYPDRKGWHQEIPRYIIEVPESQKVIALKVSDNNLNGRTYISNTISF